MLIIEVEIIPELWDEENEEFIPAVTQTLELEHSLVSLSKWESKWHKSFLHTKEKTYEEALDYIKCMTLTRDVCPDIYDHLNQSNIDQINNYIVESMTATTFSEGNNPKPNREKVTAEIIYYWMIALGIPIEFQNWHLSKLITLIRVCNIKNTPSKKMSKNEAANRHRRLNAARRRKK